MSKLVRYPLTLLAVLAAMLFLPGLAWAGTSTDEQCTPTQSDSCEPGPADGTTAGDSTGSGGTTGEQPTGEQATDPPKDDGNTEQQSGGQSTDKPAGTLFTVPLAGSGPQGSVVGLDELPGTGLGDPGTGLGDPGTGLGDPGTGLEDPLPPAPSLCTQFPTAPICSGDTPPTIPLTCDGLAQLLGQSGGCPSSFTCADLADLLGLTCPAGPPDCATLAALFHLEGCPPVPASCREFADLLGIDRCSQIPCLDTSQLPGGARDGLQPLFDGLKQIGVKECPAPDVPRTPGRGTHMPPPQPAAQQPPPQEQPQQAAATPPTTPPPAATATEQPKGKLAYTGLDLGPQLNVAWTLLVLGAGLLILGRRRV